MNKRKTIMVVLLIMISTAVSAQEKGISLSSVEYHGETRECINLEMPHHAELVKKEWKRFMKHNYAADVKGFGFLVNKEVLSALEVRLPEYTGKKLNIYTKILSDEQDQGTRMCLFMTLSNGAYINSDTNYSELEIGEKLLLKFRYHLMQEHYFSQVDQAEERIAILQDHIGKCLDKNEDLRFEIHSVERKIQDLQQEKEERERQIAENKKNIRLMKQEVREHEQKLKRKKEALTEFQ